MKGFALIGLIIALIFVAILSLMILKSTGVTNPEATKAPIERAKALDCRMKIKVISDEIKVYQFEHNKYPASLDDVTTDYKCPSTGVEYEYDSTTGKVWCPEHSPR